MEIDPSTLTTSAIYKLTTGLIVPRPVAWVTSKSEDGTINLAPFSAFNFLCNNPPLVMISITNEHGLKDTVRNVLREKEFVVNIANQDLLQVLHDSSAEYHHHESEAEILGLETLPSSVVSTPRLAAVPGSMECVLEFSREFGNYPAATMLVGEIKRFHIRDDLIHDGKVDTRALNPIARLGGPNYAKLGDIITVARAQRKEP